MNDLRRDSNGLYFISVQCFFNGYLAARKKAQEEIEKHYNQKLNLIKDCREFCYTLGEKSLTRIQLQKVLDEFKDDEQYVQNRYSDLTREIETLKQELKREREAVDRLSKFGEGTSRDRHKSSFDCLEELQIEMSERLSFARETQKQRKVKL